MVSTLNSFTSAPLLCMIKTGLTPLPQEYEDWTALWRVIGYYLWSVETAVFHTSLLKVSPVVSASCERFF
jgi:hypothetical protein